MGPVVPGYAIEYLYVSIRYDPFWFEMYGEFNWSTLHFPFDSMEIAGLPRHPDHESAKEIRLECPPYKVA